MKKKFTFFLRFRNIWQQKKTSVKAKKNKKKRKIKETNKTKNNLTNKVQRNQTKHKE